MRTVFRVIILLLILLSLPGLQAQAKSPVIDVLTIKGTINPVVADYIKRGIAGAPDDGATVIIIQIDTPGGLDTAMRDIVQSILNSTIPVIAYVAPSGARAASAGTFITLAAHVAAMAPNTAIGAATPVSIEGSMSDDLRRKVINDATAYIRSLAESHGRNATWAEQAVIQGASINSQEALDQNVVELISPDLNTLVTQLDGRTVKLLEGKQVTLHTKGVPLNMVNMSFSEDFLNTIADPNIAYMLLSLAILGIMVEVFSPGLVFPGVIGGISLFLALYALGTLPVNYAGVLLIVLAFGLFVAEALTPGFGLLFTGGLVSLIVGSLILFKGGSPLFRVDPWLVAIMAIIIGGTFAFIVLKVWTSYKKQPTTGREELIGKPAVVKRALDPEGTVFLEGELWNAVSNEGRIEPGETVVIKHVDGLNLEVSRKEGGKA